MVASRFPDVNDKVRKNCPEEVLQDQLNANPADEDGSENLAMSCHWVRSLPVGPDLPPPGKMSGGSHVRTPINHLFAGIASRLGCAYLPDMGQHNGSQGNCAPTTGDY